MVYFFEGTDVAKTRAKAFAWLAAARTKEPNAAYTRLGSEDVTSESLQEIMQSQGLFFSKMLVLLDDPFTLASSADAVLEALPRLAASENAIAILAPKLLATRAKKVTAHATKVFTQDASEKKPARGFNSGLVNALGSKNGPALWKEIVSAERLGDAPEMIHGLLHWKARDLMQKGSRVWTPMEARLLSRSLIELLSDSRSGDLPLGPALERFALSLRS